MTDYVSPIDPSRRLPDPLAPRPQGVAGHRVWLLDIAKRRSDEFLAALGEAFAARGASVERAGKPLFSRPAPDEVIERVALHGDLAVEALAD